VTWHSHGQMCEQTAAVHTDSLYNTDYNVAVLLFLLKNQFLATSAQNELITSFFLAHTTGPFTCLFCPVCSGTPKH